MQRSTVLTAFQRAAALFIAVVFLAVIMVPAALGAGCFVRAQRALGADADAEGGAVRIAAV